MFLRLIKIIGTYPLSRLPMSQLSCNNIKHKIIIYTYKLLKDYHRLIISYEYIFFDHNKITKIGRG